MYMYYHYKKIHVMAYPLRIITFQNMTVIYSLGTYRQD